jgi:hypothetical protein
MSTKKKFLVWSGLAMAAIILLTAAGCEKTVSVTGPDGTTTTSEEETTTFSTSEWWTDSTERGDITDKPITGTINEKEVAIVGLEITKKPDSYNWRFSTVEPDKTCGFFPNDDAVQFRSQDLQRGTFTKDLEESIEFEEYHSFYHYNMEPNKAMSVNVGWEATVVVKEIDEAAKTVSGWARFNFNDGKTKLEGSFKANLCEL